jgi:peptide/nickel transport system ATP-binding protein
MTDAPLLSVRNLSIRTLGPKPHTLVDSLSFEVGAERVGLVGESGSGKSLTARALMGLLRPPLAASADELRQGNTNLLTCNTRQWARLRGTDMALVLQDPRYSLNPVLTVGRQLEEMLLIHARLSSTSRRERIAAMLQAVGLADHPNVLRCYPHQLSGGMGQRVMLAMMLINGPRLLIADEPTSALDAGLREQVLELMCGLVASRRMGLLLISHDLPQVARHCDRVLIMHRGRIVDRTTAAALGESVHPYTRMLWASRPSGTTYGTRLPVLDRDWVQVPGNVS